MDQPSVLTRDPIVLITLDEAEFEHLRVSNIILLAACEAGMEWHESASNDRAPKWDEAAQEENDQLYARWIELTRAAIAKARGITSSPASS